MLHERVMPLSRRLREGGAAIGVLVFSLLATTAHAAGQPRIASINMCTDQLLLTLADPEQIVGLSPYSRDSARSWAAAAAARFPKLSGEAEDVLVLKPDFVVAGRFTKRATRELLKAEGFRVEEFDAVRSLDETRQEILRMGELVGHPDRAVAAVARIDAAVARAKEAVARRPLHVLALSRRGWVSGGDSLTSSLLAAVGLSNAASQLGYKLGGFASLETIVSLRPDLLLLSNGSDFAEDQGTAFLLHPALEQLYPPAKRIVMPERLTVCGGPMLADALETLVRELERVEH
jgi:iron complex transport system substrate-binding protein